MNPSYVYTPECKCPTCGQGTVRYIFEREAGECSDCINKRQRGSLRSEVYYQGNAAGRAAVRNGVALSQIAPPTCTTDEEKFEYAEGYIAGVRAEQDAYQIEQLMNKEAPS